MQNPPVLNGHEVATYGTPEGPVTCIVRTYEDEGECFPIRPDMPSMPGEVWCVYLWNDEVGEWNLKADCVDLATAESLAKLLAGTADTYQP